MTDTAVLIVSCDAYADVWPVCLSLYEKYWQDCPFPIYLLTNERVFESEGVLCLSTGVDRDWSSSLIAGLQSLPHRRVLVMLEDFLLDQPVDTQAILKFDRLLATGQAASIRLVPKPPATLPLHGHPRLGSQEPHAAFRASLQACLWDRATLLSLMVPGEDAWEAEMAASRRSCNISMPFLALRPLPREEWPIAYINAVIKRKWTQGAVQHCRREGVSIDLSRRGVCGRYDRFRQTRIFGAVMSTATNIIRRVLGAGLYERLKRHSLLRRILY